MVPFAVPVRGAAEGDEDPWLCGPGFRRVCLYGGMVEPELPRGTDAVKRVGKNSA